MSDNGTRPDKWHPNKEAAYWCEVALDYIRRDNFSFDIEKVEYNFQKAWDMGDNAAGYYLADLICKGIIQDDLEKSRTIIIELSNRGLITEEQKSYFGVVDERKKSPVIDQLLSDGITIEAIEALLSNLPKDCLADPKTAKSHALSSYANRLRNKLDRIVTARLKSKNIFIPNKSTVGNKLSLAFDNSIKFKICYDKLFDYLLELNDIHKWDFPVAKARIEFIESEIAKL